MMKRIVILLSITMLASTYGVSAQSNNSRVTDVVNEVNNFKLDQGSVTWSKVYDFDASDLDGVKDWFLSNFKITKESEKTFIGESNSDSLPIEEVGYKRMQVTMLLTHPCIVYFIAEFKDNRYRVIVNRIIWTPQLVTVRNGIGTMSLNEIAVQRDRFKPNFSKSLSVQLDKMLDYMFTARLNRTSSDDNW